MMNTPATLIRAARRAAAAAKKIPVPRPRPKAAA